MRILAFDTSLSCPGAAIIEVKGGKPKVIAVSHVKPNTKLSHAVRHELVYAWAVSFLALHVGKGIDIVTREDFHGQSSKQNYPVLSAWAACARAVEFFGLEFSQFVTVGRGGKRKTHLGIPQSNMKNIVVGSGVATKEEIEESVRSITGYKGEFACDDESDAVALGLAYLINEELISK
ncbi:Crossover junction endodeoxyribonuclease RuvC [Priestia megaterium]|nr:Crossover junction endodeoxyribonuclease RuvC [Priestia megaterium]